MEYHFQNQAEGKVQITDEQNNTFTLKQINSTANTSEAATSIMGGLSTMLDIVGWQVNDVVRVVNQDVVEGTGGEVKTATITYDNSSNVIQYNGDATLYYFNKSNGTNATIESGTVIQANNNYVFYAPATSNYTAAVLIMS